tara:strand:- start:5975 stop:6445 length:471 start_codon:yes stop_codon:yes gene_type:complete
MIGMPTTIDIYIPRILGNVKENDVKEAFINLNIGLIMDIDMHRKRNENGYYYYFAFIKLYLYETNEAERLYDILEQKGIMHLVYDEEAFQYWEVKKHIPKNMRNKKSQNIVNDYVMPMLNEIIGTSDICGLTAQDRIDMVKEYEELEREIFQLTCL